MGKYVLAVLTRPVKGREDPVLFGSPRPGPRDQPKKSAARDLIVELRKRNYSGTRSASL
jgi:hypothetical protein